ncbi:MAG TPA: hypothetical protein VMD98_11080, partial [Bryocella sp.]|nr:hypothetical protein [Bryocella sp.]
MKRGELVAGLWLAICGLTLTGGEYWVSHSARDTGMGGSIAAVPSVEDESLANPSVPPLAAPLPSPADHMPASVPGYSLRRDV